MGLTDLLQEKEDRNQDAARRLATMESELMIGRNHTMNLASQIVRGTVVKL